MISYITIGGIPNSSTIQSIENLYKEIFVSIDHDKFIARMTHEESLSVLAMDGDHIVAFKTGYALDNEIFYSWIGGVLPEYRQKGIANELMNRQHEWCKQNGFQVVRTKTMNRWRSMLILNLKNGFNIVDTYADEKGEIKILLEKNLEM